MSINMIFTASLAFLCLMIATPRMTYASPRLSQDEAANLVKNFTHRLTGLTANSVPEQKAVAEAMNKIEYDEPNKANHASDGLINNLSALLTSALLENKGHPYWKAAKPGVFNLEVDDETGKVVAYTNFVTQDSLNDQPAGTPISKASALKIAKEAMAAAGQPTETMKLEWVSEEQGSIPSMASMHKISIAWLRTYQGIPFYREGGGVILEAETGDIISVGIGCISPDPLNTLDNVSQTQAVQIANAQLNAVSLSALDIPLTSVNKEIIHPNFYWQTGDALQGTDEALVGSQTRIVWDCHFGTSENNFEVWADAETGDVVGGDYTRALGGKAKSPTPKFGHQLKHSEIVAWKKIK